MAGFLLLQLGLTSNQHAADSSQLAVATRSADHTANRGSGRTRIDAQSSASELAAPASAPLDTTTTVVPETTTVAPTTTVVAPTTTTVRRVTTTVPRPAVAAAPKPPANDTGVVGDDVWTKLAACESGNRNDLGAPYYGYFQFSAGTWTGLGGSGLPSDHTYDEQKAMAIKLQARSGWGQWPVCSKKALA